MLKKEKEKILFCGKNLARFNKKLQRVPKRGFRFPGEREGHCWFLEM